MKHLSAVLVILIVIGLAVPAWPQYQSRIVGRVLDTAGNPIEKAEVSIVSPRSTSVRYDVKTDRDGKFAQIGITPGYYIMNVKKAGFAPASREIHLTVAAESAFDITLQPAAVEAERTYSAADKAFIKGNKLYAEQKYAEAAAAYEEAIGLNAANWAYYLNLGLTHKKGGTPEQTLAAFRKAAELNPDSYSANKETGEALAKAGQFAEAKPFYEKAAELSPTDPDGQYNLGACLINLGEQEAALARFEKAVELKPDYADAYYQMGTLLVGQNKVPEAVAALEKFLSLAPDHEKAGIARQLLDYLKK